MKKTYEKPCAMMEYFTLTQSIANGCGNRDLFYGTPMYGSPQSCAWVGADGTRYWTNETTCDDTYPEDLVIEDGCYNAPSGSNQVFSS